MLLLGGVLYLLSRQSDITASFSFGAWVCVVCRHIFEALSKFEEKLEYLRI